MPLYEYFCPPCSHSLRSCDRGQMDHPAVCPSGHTTNNRVLSLFARATWRREGGVATMTMAGGDDCCSPGSMGHGGCSCC